MQCPAADQRVRGVGCSPACTDPRRRGTASQRARLENFGPFGTARADLPVAADDGAEFTPAQASRALLCSRLHDACMPRASSR